MTTNNSKMNNMTWIYVAKTLLLLLLLIVLRPTNAAEPIAFVNVNVITMVDELVLMNKTVLINNGVISAIENTESFIIPNEYQQIDATNQYLSPGLGDSHTHLGAEVGVAGGIGENQLMVYLANGVTTIINQGDFLAPFGNGLMSLRDRIDANTLPGPKIYTASYARGAADTGTPAQIVNSFDDGVKHVQDSIAAGYDFIKIYNSTPKLAADGIFSEADQQNIAVLGHFPANTSAKETLDKGLDMVSHSAAYYWQHFKFRNDQGLVASALDMTLTSGAYVSSTLFIEETIASIWGGNTAAFDQFVAQDEMQYAHPNEIQVWRNGANGSRWNPAGSTPGALNPGRDFVRSYIKFFFDSGVKFVAGTDSPTVLGAPGFSTHHELNSIHRLGVSNFDSLATATVNMGEFISKHIPNTVIFGKIIVDARADFILSFDNPLEDLSALQHRVGVMAAGNWYTAEFLQVELDKVAESYRTVNPPPPPPPPGGNGGGGGSMAFLLCLLVLLRLR